MATQQSASDGLSWQTRVFNWLPTVAFLFLTVNSVDSAYRCHDPPALAFIVFAYSDLMMLLFCLRRFEKLGPESPPEQKGQLKAAVWVLTTALNLAFAWRVAEIMPPALAVVVWLMSGSVAIGGFYGLFIYRDADDNVAAHAYSVVENTQPSPDHGV